MIINFLYRAFLVAQMVKSLSAIQRPQFYPWVQKILWRRAWQPTPVFLLGIPWMEEPGRLQSKYLVILGNTSYQVLIKSVKLLSYYQRHFSTCNIKRRKHTGPDLNLNKKKTYKAFLIKKQSGVTVLLP